MLLRVALAVCIAVGLVGAVFAQQWPRFRGVNGSGVGDADSLPAEWGDDDFRWRVKLPGVGHASPILWGQRIFLVSGEEKTGRRIVSCVSADSGKQLWSRAFESATHGMHKLNSFASSTPAADESRVYFCWATPKEFIVVALDHQGKELWRRDLGPFKSGHGFGGSPVIYDDVLIVTNEQQGDSFLIAMDKTNGRTRWQIDRNSKVTYTTPCVYPRDGRDELIFTNYEYGVTAVDPRDGREAWSLEVFDRRHIETAIASPVLAGDLVLASAGWLGVRQQVIAVRPEFVDGRPAAREVWRIERGAPLCTTPLVVGELVFLWSDEGIVTCAGAATGEVHFQKRVGGTWYASPVCAGNRVYNVNADGDVIVLAAAKEFRQLARNKLAEGSHSTPAIAHGRMYLRTFSQLIAIE